MRLLDKLERRFGRYAIRGLIGYILFLKCMVFVVHQVNREFISQLTLLPFSMMDGEWWRLLSFMLLPGSFSLLMFVLTVYIMLLCSYTIEAGFGAFRLNLFVIAYVLCQWGLAALAGSPAGFYIGDATGSIIVPNPESMGDGFFTNLFFVFAVLDPHRVFLLFGIVPLKVWILALVDAGLVAFNVIRTPELWLSTVLSLTPFLCFGIPIYLRHLRHRTRVGSRRIRFKANSLTVADSFHRCSVCGRTDASDPELDFRITEDGLEYCSEHLPKNQGN